MIPCPPFELDVNGTPGFNRDFSFVHRALRLPGAGRKAYAEEGSAGRAICTCVDADDKPSWRSSDEPAIARARLTSSHPRR